MERIAIRRDVRFQSRPSDFPVGQISLREIHTSDGFDRWFFIWRRQPCDFGLKAGGSLCTVVDRTAVSGIA